MSPIRKGIARVIHDAHFREELVQKGLENVGRFEPGLVAERYLEVYRRV